MAKTRITRTTCTWAEHVRTAAHLAGPPPGPEPAIVAAACRLLAAHTHTLLGLPTVTVIRSIPRAEVPRLHDDTHGRVDRNGDATTITPMDGPAAGVELLELHRWARWLLGASRGKDRRVGSCAGCGLVTLVRWHGEESVECEGCGRVYTSLEYEWLVSSEVRTA